MAKKLLSNGAVVYDNWQVIDDSIDIAKASDIPAGKVIVSLTHWREFHTELVLRGSEKLGLLLQPDQSPR
ncbi:MAG TPA: hypothetical protein VLA24_04310, partial [Pseudomonadales bacterium]|nr:hypothetical protein [Pseudomonadales bacterium]